MTCCARNSTSITSGSTGCTVGRDSRYANAAETHRGERVPSSGRTGQSDLEHLDFVGDNLANGRRIKCLTVADDFAHSACESPPTSVWGELRHPATGRGRRSFVAIRRGSGPDNGPEFTREGR